MKLIEKAIEVLKRGELIVYPTDTLYGIGADAFNREAVKKVYDVKKRSYDKPISIAVGNLKQIEEIAILNEMAYKIIEEFMPGGITIILKKARDMPFLKDTVAIRMPANEIALKIAEKIPITATSANIHGKPPPYTVEMAKKQLKDKISLYIDYGKLAGIPSTIIDVSEEKIKIIREGLVKKEEIYGRIREI